MRPFQNLFPVIGLTAISGGLITGCQSAIAARSTLDLELAASGHSAYSIVEAGSATEAEQFAAAELAQFIEQITGASIRVVKESKFRGEKAIYLGWTQFAQESGIGVSELGDEEWTLRAVGDDLIITGGRPRGTRYGVYEFLETQAGIRFLTAQTTHVPKKPTLRIPGNLRVQDEPAYSRREIYMVVNGYGPDDYKLFQTRRKLNSYANAARQIGAKYGFSMEFGSPYSTHVHHRYVGDFPEAFEGHPTYFALTNRGRRAYPERYFVLPEKDRSGRPKGQVCMSHPDVKRIFAEKLREYIKRDRQEIDRAGAGEPYPRIYSLVPDDGTSGKCFCEKCLATAEKYGSYAGVVLEFTNFVARDIAEDYPDIRVTSSAYLYYRDIPHGIRPRKNVIVYIAQLGAAYNTFPKRDRTRSMLHPLNREARKEWDEWAKISGTMGVHDYWNHYNVSALATNLKFYYGHGARHLLTENILLGSRVHSFADLEFYVASKLLQDPTQDAEAIIDEFMTLAYGGAAPVMKRFLAYLERRHEEEAGYVAIVPERARKYLDPDYFIETDAMLAEAERLVADDARKVADIRQERLPLDRTMLYLWTKLTSQATDRWPFDRDRVFARLSEHYAWAYEKYGGWGKARKRRDDVELEYIKNMPAVPAQFADKEIIDLCGPKLKLTRGGRAPRTAVGDPDAATGKAWRIDASMAGDTGAGRVGDHQRPPQFGLSDCVSEPKFLVRKRLEDHEIPKDEAYHWHFVGRMQATPTMYFWAHHSWVFDQRLISAYNAALPDQDLHDVYVSLKLEGPAYVPGSNSENSFSIDRIILVKVDQDEANDEQEKQ